eukprot:scaffold98489_cov51-Phaeocystis_antarctica.AAC.4
MIIWGHPQRYLLSLSAEDAARRVLEGEGSPFRFSEQGTGRVVAWGVYCERCLVQRSTSAHKTFSMLSDT